MAKIDRTILKTYFETGKRPVQSEFENFIDSTLNHNEDKANLSEMELGTDDEKFSTPKGVKRAIETLVPNATISTKGITEIATLTEVDTGINKTKFVTPEGAKRAVLRHSIIKKVNGFSPNAAGNVVIPIPVLNDSGWLEITTFSLAISNFDANSSLRYRLKNGVVFLDGCIMGGISQTNGINYNLFTIPAGFRPSRKISVQILRSDSSLDTYLIGRIEIDVDGIVYGVNYSNLWNSLSGLTYLI